MEALASMADNSRYNKVCGGVSSNSNSSGVVGDVNSSGVVDGECNTNTLAKGDRIEIQWGMSEGGDEVRECWCGLYKMIRWDCGRYVPG